MSDTIRALQPQKMVRGLKFDLHLCFRICKKLVFSWCSSYTAMCECKFECSTLYHYTNYLIHFETKIWERNLWMGPNEPHREKTFFFCICENKDADQRLCFRYTDSTIPLLPKSKISSLYPSCVTAQPGLCRTLSETPKTSFLTTRLKCFNLHIMFLPQVSTFLNKWKAYDVPNSNEASSPMHQDWRGRSDWSVRQRFWQMIDQI